MAVLIDENTKVICQGFTGAQDALGTCVGGSTGAIRMFNTRMVHIASTEGSN
ncbi:hypothetical protein [Ruegeria sp. ANG-R]|uniref:hypothetical protein n=1 Tax=Ruegeria sp. ANG-R TaxID=1577903 RepID=UPI000A4650E5|nr:hypothetical protein [Ruegeria sp. ANG-R]